MLESDFVSRAFSTKILRSLRYRAEDYIKRSGIFILGHLID